MGLLSGGAASLFGELFGRLYLDAAVFLTVTTHDARGNPRRTLKQRSCKAQVDSATDRMRRDPEFSQTDRAVYVLASTLDGALTSDCEIVVNAGPYAGTRWKVADPIDRDPGGAYWLARAVLGKAVPRG